MPYRYVLSRMSVRSKLLALLASVVLLLFFSGFLLQQALTENASFSEKQFVIIQTLREVTTLRKEYNRLRYHYNNYLNNPLEQTMPSVLEHIEAFGSEAFKFHRYEEDKINSILSDLDGLSEVARNVSDSEDTRIWRANPLYGQANELKIHIDETL